MNKPGKRRKSSETLPTNNTTSATHAPELKDYRHDTKRRNIPESGLATYEKESKQLKHYSYDPHLDPDLIWTGKKEHSSLEIDTVSLHIHERISTLAILTSVKRKQLIQTTLDFFATPTLPLDKRIEFYQHDVAWSNRLILGDSLLVMNSLVERELMATKVQMIYIDPPYGISYNSNFQPFINNRNVKDGDDESLSREPEQIKAYRDIWELEIHSYLTYLRDRLLIARELLNETGSCFVQINDDNLHYVKQLMIEIFGKNNFVNIIPFRKRAAYLERSKGLFELYDYIIWFAKDFEKMKFRRLYVPQKIEEAFRGEFKSIEENGKVRKATIQDVLDYDPETSKLFRTNSTVRKNSNPKNTFGIKVNGKTIMPPHGQEWKADLEGMNRLISLNRLTGTGPSRMYKTYLSDFPYSNLTNVWDDTMAELNRIYAVQTDELPIQRCMLMTTDPGDLVLDPTCGSGTTAFVAEMWGRRWITCDTSRVSIAVARERLITALFEYYELAHPTEGVRSGFNYTLIPHITLGTLANNDPPEQEILYDKPIVDKSKVRVSGPLTVEGIPVPTYRDYDKKEMHSQGDDQTGRPGDPGGDHINDMIELLKKTQVVNFPTGKRLELENLRSVSGRGILHAEGNSLDSDKSSVVISFGPRHGPITIRQLEEAIGAAQWEYNILIMVGFNFEPDVQAFIQKNPHPRLKLLFAHINPDVLVKDLLKTPKGSQIFSVFGQPDIDVRKTSEGYVVELNGVDIYDPVTGTTSQSSGNDVAAWFLDTDYDGYTFRISQPFFPNPATSENPWDKLENALRGLVDPDKMEMFRRTISLPFPATKNKIAVKVVDLRGNEIITVRDLNGNQ